MYFIFAEGECGVDRESETANRFDRPSGGSLPGVGSSRQIEKCNCAPELTVALDIINSLLTRTLLDRL